MADNTAVNDTVEAVTAMVEAIAKELNEPNRDLLQRIVSYIGIEATHTLLKETRQIEAEGGMKIRSGKRRRTPGGVFIHLVRRQLPDQVREEIFAQPGWRHVWIGQGPNNSTIIKSDRVRNTPSYQNAESWDQIHQAVKELLQQKQYGKADTVKVDLRGRPGKLMVRNNFVITTLETDGTPPKLAPELPIPPKVRLTYLVYIPRKIWEKVAAQLRKDPEDQLIVSGYLTYDNTLKKLSVFSTHATTTKSQTKRS